MPAACLACVTCRWLMPSGHIMKNIKNTFRSCNVAATDVEMPPEEYHSMTLQQLTCSESITHCTGRETALCQNNFALQLGVVSGTCSKRADKRTCETAALSASPKHKAISYSGFDKPSRTTQIKKAICPSNPFTSPCLYKEKASPSCIPSRS
jgi:hypothetical protein